MIEPAEVTKVDFFVRGIDDPLRRGLGLGAPWAMVARTAMARAERIVGNC